MTKANVAMLIFSFIPAACQTGRPVPQKAEVERPAVVSTFSDTAVSNVTFNDARTFELRRPGERYALRATLGRQRELWQAVRPHDYEFLLRVDCFCPEHRGWLLIEARRGQPLQAWDRAGKAAALSEWSTFSIDTLFEMLDRAAGMDGVVQVAFDPRWHFPANVRTVKLPGPDAWTIIDARGLRPVR
jgi:hypothetical protein